MESGIKINDISKLVEQVKEAKVEITITLTPNENTVTITPWKPFQYSCPYRGEQS